MKKTPEKTAKIESTKKEALSKRIVSFEEDDIDEEYK
jgi:hypothetical protein